MYRGDLLRERDRDAPPRRRSRGSNLVLDIRRPRRIPSSSPSSRSLAARPLMLVLGLVSPWVVGSSTSRGPSRCRDGAGGDSRLSSSPRRSSSSSGERLRGGAGVRGCCHALRTATRRRRGRLLVVIAVSSRRAFGVEAPPPIILVAQTRGGRGGGNGRSNACAHTRANTRLAAASESCTRASVVGALHYYWLLHCTLHPSCCVVCITMY